MWTLSTNDPFQSSSVARAAAGACCVLLSLGAAAHPARSYATDSFDAAYWAAPVDEAPGFVAGSVSDATHDSDLAFVAQGWRWSPGTNAWISVLVRVNSLQAIAFARIGGLYGP